MLAEEPDVRKALVRFREGLGGNLRGAPSLLDYRLSSAKLASPAPNQLLHFTLVPQRYQLRCARPRASLVPQRHHRIDSGCEASGQVGGERGCCKERGDGENKDGGIGSSQPK